MKGCVTCGQSRAVGMFCRDCNAVEGCVAFIHAHWKQGQEIEDLLGFVGGGSLIDLERKLAGMSPRPPLIAELVRRAKQLGVGWQQWQRILKRARRVPAQEGTVGEQVTTAVAGVERVPPEPVQEVPEYVRGMPND